MSCGARGGQPLQGNPEVKGGLRGPPVVTVTIFRELNVTTVRENGERWVMIVGSAVKESASCRRNDILEIKRRQARGGERTRVSTGYRTA
jgi:hypothetical protein